MRRKGILSLTIVIILVVAGLLVPTTLAKKPDVSGSGHFKDNTLGWGRRSLDASGCAAGLANESYVVTLEAKGDAAGVCVNRSGQEAPGRNPSPILVGVSESDEFRTDENGQACFELSAKDANQYVLISPTPKEFGCPNGNWRVTVTDGATAWTEAWLSLYAKVDGQLLLVDEAYFVCDINTPDICTPVE